MKPLQGHGDAIKKGAITAEDALRYAMSLPVATTITGIDKPEILKQNLKIARNFKPMDTAEMQRVRDSVKQYAADGRFEQHLRDRSRDLSAGGRLELFKTTKKYAAFRWPRNCRLTALYAAKASTSSVMSSDCAAPPVKVATASCTAS